MIALAILGAIAAVAAAVAVALVVRRRWVIVTVRGHSMAPTLRDGERIVARRWSPAAAVLGTGDLIVFLPDDDGYRIKRVAGVAGDVVPAWVGALAGAVVPPGHVIVRGDNPRSEGSRQLGYVALDAIVARCAARSSASSSASSDG